MNTREKCIGVAMVGLIVFWMYQSQPQRKLKKTVRIQEPTGKPTGKPTDKPAEEKH
jgi:plastocyanin domain-containing protein